MPKPIVTIALTKRKGVGGSAAVGHADCQADPELLYPSHHEPYLVVRIMAAVYQPELIKVLRGRTPLAQIGAGCCMVIHPNPYDEQGALSTECRDSLIGAVQNAVMAMRLRMCLVWAPTNCSFVELDGSVNDSTEPPSGGFPLPFRIAFDELREPNLGGEV